MPRPRVPPVAPIWLRRFMVRSIASTGVSPDPAVRNRMDAGGGSGSTKSPRGAASRTTVPGASPDTRWLDRKPSGIALTVTVTTRAPARGTEVSE